MIIEDSFKKDDIRFEIDELNNKYENLSKRLDELEKSKK